MLMMMVSKFLPILSLNVESVINLIIIANPISKNLLRIISLFISLSKLGGAIINNKNNASKLIWKNFIDSELYYSEDSVRKTI